MGGKAAGLVQYKAGRFDASVGAAYELRGLFSDGEGRPVGINLTQGETMDSKALSLFGRFGYAVTDTMRRSEEHTSELQSLIRKSYAVFCLNKKKKQIIKLTST